MVLKKKVTVSWSGGKDSAFALYKILLSGEFEVVHLHTVINEETRRVGLHGVQEELIDRQAKSIGIPLIKIYLEPSETHAAYERLMKTFYQQCALKGISGIVFGDIFLEDLKKFREELLKPSGLLPEFPLWMLNTRILLDDFMNTGFKTLICSADAKYFNPEQLGITIDDTFMQTLSAEVDPCGEYGEFHTFVYDGPVFKRPVEVALGEVVKKVYSYQKKNEDGGLEKLESAFWFQDLSPRITA